MGRRKLLAKVVLATFFGGLVGFAVVLYFSTACFAVLTSGWVEQRDSSSSAGTDWVRWTLIALVSFALLGALAGVYLGSTLSPSPDHANRPQTPRPLVRLWCMFLGGGIGICTGFTLPVALCLPLQGVGAF